MHANNKLQIVKIWKLKSYLKLCETSATLIASTECGGESSLWQRRLERREMRNDGEWDTVVGISYAEVVRHFDLDTMFCGTWVSRMYVRLVWERWIIDRSFSLELWYEEASQQYANFRNNFNDLLSIQRCNDMFVLIDEHTFEFITTDIFWSLVFNFLITLNTIHSRSKSFNHFISEVSEPLDLYNLNIFCSA